MQNVVSQEQLCEKIIATLGENFTKEEIQSCLKGLEIIEPKVTKLFWQAESAKAGVFIVLSGKARLLDDADNLIATVAYGESFIEQSLFPEENYINFAARASTGLKLCYLSDEVIHKLIVKYPRIRERLRQRAEFWDILLMCRQNSQISRISSTEEIFKALCLFERYNIEPGENAKKLFEDSQLLLLRRGQLKNAANRTLTAGNIYTDTDIQRKWEVTKPTIAYRH